MQVSITINFHKKKKGRGLSGQSIRRLPNSFSAEIAYLSLSLYPSLFFIAIANTWLRAVSLTIVCFPLRGRTSTVHSCIRRAQKSAPHVISIVGTAPVAPGIPALCLPPGHRGPRTLQNGTEMHGQGQWYPVTADCLLISVLLKTLP